MKKTTKDRKKYMRFSAVILCLALISGSTGIASVALTQDSKFLAAYSEVTATLSPHRDIVVDGVSQTFYNVQGQEVHPVLFGGTTYLPVRAIGELMDKNVNWDESTRTVTLAGKRSTGKVTGTPDQDTSSRRISAQIRYDFTIVVDDTVRVFTDANGSVVYPLLYQGTTYLPVRAIGELMGRDVSWNAGTDTVTLTSKSSGGSLVTDADSFHNSGSTGTAGSDTTGTGQYIGEEKAKEIALSHAGLTAGQVTFVKAYLDFDDGRYEYEVEFYNRSDYTEYDYEIDALTGKILSVDYDAENYAPSAGNSASYIGLEKAKSICLNRAGLSASEVTFGKAVQDRDDGRVVYEIEFFSGNYEYEFEIDAVSGAVLDYDRDYRWD